MQVLIYEPAFRGHRLNFVRLLIPALNRLGADIVLATSAEAIRSAEWQVQIAPIVEGATVDASLATPGPGVVANALQRYRDLTGVVARHCPDWMLIPYADGVAQMMGLAAKWGRQILPSSLPVEGLQLRGGFAYPQPNLRSRVRAELSWRLAAAYPWHRLHQLDPLVHENLLIRRPSLAENIDVMPDPIPTPPKIDREAARRELELGTGGRWCGCVGGLDVRKGIDRLIKAFADADLDGGRLLLAGRTDATVRAQLKGPYATLVKRQQIVVLDRYISDHELDLAIAAMDLVCTPYPRHIGSASIVIRAAAVGRPVLGSDYGWIGRTVPQFKLGATCDTTDRAAFAAALKAALELSQAHESSAAAREFTAFHTPENFQAVWMRAMGERAREA